MALLNAKRIADKEKIKLEIDKDIYAEIKNYCTWSGISEIDHFFEEAASFIFSKDKEWKNHIRSIKREKIKESM
ncbi:MAG: hypothetical protein BGO90_06210 [Legionella sp. 40-6]|nr:hypothetical protein [Legionella sp.]OJY48521.1 MAG: hypothetical protein BGO90_06210 [Legionella sp. 40-6]